MKRPEGFDPPASAQPAGRSGSPASRSPQPSRSAQSGTPKPAAQKPATQKPATQAPAPRNPSRAPEQRRPTARIPASTPTAPRREPQAARARRGEPRPDAAARAALRAAARERRRYERAEVRRFTRRARNRRLVLVVVAAIVVSLIAMVLTAIFSPILALRQITVDGTSRLDAAEVSDAVADQLGTPLALIDYDLITRELGGFPLIRSYITEVVPPGTLLIHVSERQPVASIRIAEGFALVDPAGVTVQQSAERIPGVPLLAAAEPSGPAFEAMVEVLLALPPDLLAQVDGISAHTQNDVSLVLTGVGQKVIWGGADRSDAKARLLAALIGQTDPAAAGVFDVSAPGNGVFRPS